MACFFFVMKILLILIFTFISCSQVKKINWSADKQENIKLGYYQEFEKEDYIEHLIHFEKMYLLDKKNKIIKLNSKNQKYLNSLVGTIIENNELFFNQIRSSKFTIIKSKIPFHFSLPGRRFFFSTSLLDKYVKNEAMLFCLIVFELIRSERYIYNKKIIIPTGTLSTSRMLSLLRLDTSDKVEIHKWAFYILKRLGLDTDSYLSWLQIKNRNSLDFALQLGDVQTISREESLFKAFLIEEVKNLKKTQLYKGSSRDFYRFLGQLKG